MQNNSEIGYTTYRERVCQISRNTHYYMIHWFVNCVLKYSDSRKEVCLRSRGLYRHSHATYLRIKNYECISLGLIFHWLPVRFRMNNEIATIIVRFTNKTEYQRHISIFTILFWHANPAREGFTFSDQIINPTKYTRNPLEWSLSEGFKR